MRVEVNHHFIEILRGDITRQSTEAIVNAANNQLWMGGGVAGAIKKAGGELIETEAMALGPVAVGDSVITSGGTLPVRVIHAAVMGQDLHTNAELILAATRSALDLAEKERISSVSFPALGTGVGGFSPFHCARIMIAEAVRFLQASRSVQLVRFVLFDEAMANVFEEELRVQFSAKRHP